jgi:hypothetical protein
MLVVLRVGSMSTLEQSVPRVVASFFQAAIAELDSILRFISAQR